MTSAANRNGWGRSALPSIFNTGIAAMKTASGGSSMPKATAAPIPPKYPRDRGTSICNRPTWTTRPCWVECGADMVASIRLLIVWGRCLRCPGRQGVADGCLPWGGFLGVAALPFWTPRLLIEICACVAVYGAAGGVVRGVDMEEGEDGPGEGRRGDLGRHRRGQGPPPRVRGGRDRQGGVQ